MAEARIRAATTADADDLWAILEPVIRAGETYALPRDMTSAQALAFWCAPAHRVMVALLDGRVAGTYYLKANHQGGGDHVANCGYVTAAWAAGRGVARAMCADSLERARAAGFLAMQYNLVVATNERAIRLWQSFGFQIVGRLPRAFRHPAAGLVDAVVMHRFL
jgi:ribosomal protein S18 acetylase RimI-like enzyme